ncbi:hypothetical protein GCM10009814_29070 [Lapillicoccus jejuensis]
MPEPGERARQQRLVRLRAARALHPDHGGDHDAYVAAMAALDAADPAREAGAGGAYGASYGGPPDGAEVVLVARRGWRWPRRLRRRVRDYRRRNWARL